MAVRLNPRNQRSIPELAKAAGMTRFTLWRKLTKLAVEHPDVLVHVGRGTLLKRYKVSMVALKRAWPELFEDDRSYQEQLAALRLERRADKKRLMALAARVSQLESLLKAA